MGQFRVSLPDEVIDELDAFCDVVKAPRKAVIETLIRWYLGDLANEMSSALEQLGEDPSDISKIDLESSDKWLREDEDEDEDDDEDEEDEEGNPFAAARNKVRRISKGRR